MSMQASTTPRVDVGVLLAEPTQFTARRIRVAGVLQRDESAPTASLRLVLCDDKNRAIPVTSWEPLESDLEQVAPRTARTEAVSEFLGRPVVLFGTWCELEGRYLLRVESGYVVDGRQRHFSPGEYVILSGSIERRAPVDMGHEAPPAGNWLALSQPIRVGRLRTDSVYLDAHQPFPQGYHGRFHGRLSKGYFGGVEGARTPYAVLTGVSNLRAGEPIYDGTQFVSAVDGRPLRSLVAAVPVAELNAWAADPRYTVGAIEDSLNLGIKYIVNVGDGIGGQVTIRIIPVVADTQNDSAVWLTNAPPTATCCRSRPPPPPPAVAAAAPSAVRAGSTRPCRRCWRWAWASSAGVASRPASKASPVSLRSRAGRAGNNPVTPV